MVTEACYWGSSRTRLGGKGEAQYELETVDSRKFWQVSIAVACDEAVGGRPLSLCKLI